MQTNVTVFKLVDWTNKKAGLANKTSQTWFLLAWSRGEDKYSKEVACSFKTNVEDLSCRMYISQPQLFILPREPRQIKLPPTRQLGGRGCPLPGLHPRRPPTLRDMELGEIYLIKTHQKGSKLPLRSSLPEGTPTGTQEKRDSYISTVLREGKLLFQGPAGLGWGRCRQTESGSDGFRKMNDA